MGELLDQDRRILEETDALELQSHGEVAITVAKALLGMDLILVCFVAVGFRTGSLLFLWWVVAEGLLGVILMGIGANRKSKAQKALSALEPE
ncbi:MAG TPA: hypothetical protein VMX38_06320 [Verrucomicrobiae bacterium]|jgi:hypothetical protein|nr:hypothetical protein [Verrucomicrobiae bacterium]